MTKNSAMTKLANGVKVRAKSWEKGKYIQMDEESGQIVDNNGKIFNLMKAKEKDWLEYKETVKSSSKADNSEVIKMIQELMKEVKELKEAQETQYTDVDSSEVAQEVEATLSQSIEQSIKENMPQDETSLKDMLKIVYNVESATEVKELFKNELLSCNDKRDVAKAVTKFIPYCWMGGRKIKTVARYYSDMRNIIKEVNDQFQDYALELFILPADAYERIKKADTKKVIDKLKDKETYSLDEVKEVIATLKEQVKKALKLGTNVTIEQWKNAGLPIAKQQTVERARAYLFTAYLAFVTGRRITELLKTLSLVKKENKWYFKGIAKKGHENEEVPAITLDNDFDFLNKVLKQIRKDIDATKMTNVQVNSKFNHVFNRALKSITGLKYTYHDLREIYADLAYREFGLKDGTDREEIDYKSDILGHQVDKDRLVATEHYMTKKGK